MPSEARSVRSADTLGGRPPTRDDEPIATVPIEWGVDMDTKSTTFSFVGKGINAKLKGRCKRCWGELLARRDENGAWTGIRCRVRGTKIEGERGLGINQESAWYVLHHLRKIFEDSPIFLEGIVEVHENYVGGFNSHVSDMQSHGEGC